jgi:hypothetical protein
MDRRDTGRVLAGRYELRHELPGRPDVYRAHDRLWDRPVDVEFLPAAPTRDERAWGALRERVHAAAAVQDPHVAAVLGSCGRAAARSHTQSRHQAASSPGTAVSASAPGTAVSPPVEQCFVVTEALDGPTLSTSLAGGGALAPGSAVRLTLGILAGLAAVHRAGLRHGHVSPGRIVLAGGDRAVLTGHWLPERSESLAPEKPERGLVMADGPDGTPSGRGVEETFAAPEVIGGAAPTAQSDVYSVGAVLAAALSGRLAPTTALEGLESWGLAGVLRRALDEAPERRFGAAAEFAEALTGAVTGDHPSSPATAVLLGTIAAEAPAGSERRSAAISSLGSRGSYRHRRGGARRTAGTLTGIVALALGVGVMVGQAGGEARTDVPGPSAAPGLEQAPAQATTRHAGAGRDAPVPGPYGAVGGVGSGLTTPSLGAAAATEAPSPAPSAPTAPEPSPTQPGPTPTEPGPAPTEPGPTPTEPGPTPTDPTDPTPDPGETEPTPTPTPTPTDDGGGNGGGNGGGSGRGGGNGRGNGGGSGDGG